MERHHSRLVADIGHVSLLSIRASRESSINLAGMRGELGRGCFVGKVFGGIPTTFSFLHWGRVIVLEADERRLSFLIAVSALSGSIMDCFEICVS